MKLGFALMAISLLMLMLPNFTFAQFAVNQGGTGWVSIENGALIYGNGTSPLATTSPATLGDILQFNGSIPTWVSSSSLGIVGLPVGNDQEIQFNDGGQLGSDPSFKFDKSQVQIDIGAEGQTAAIQTPNATSANTPGGGFAIGGGAGRGSGGGGAISISGGGGEDSIDGTGSGGAVVINAGDGGSGSTSSGGLLLLVGGSSQGTNGDGGNVDIQAGFARGSGQPGHIRFQLHDGVGGIWNLSNLTSYRTFSLPDESGTFGFLESDQTWSGTNTFSTGPSATTTINVGDIGNSTSHACFNTKNTSGQDINFYFNGTTMVVQTGTCS